MRKIVAVCDFLSEENKDAMHRTAAECGFEMSFFDSNEEASGKVGDAEAAYLYKRRGLIDLSPLFFLSVWYVYQLLGCGIYA